MADIAAGMNAYQAILEAVIARRNDGHGTHIEVSLFDTLADWMTVPLLHYDYTGKAPERVGLRHPSIAPYGVFETADERQILISIQNEREWKKLCAEVLGQPGLVTENRFSNNLLRVANRPALEDVIGAIFAKLTFAETSRRLEAANIAFAALNGVAELSDHPALRRMTVETPSGEVSLPARPVRHNGEASSTGAVPGPGQQTKAISLEFAEELA